MTKGAVEDVHFRQSDWMKELYIAVDIACLLDGELWKIKESCDDVNTMQVTTNLPFF